MNSRKLPSTAHGTFFDSNFISWLPKTKKEIFENFLLESSCENEGFHRRAGDRPHEATGHYIKGLTSRGEIESYFVDRKGKPYYRLPLPLDFQIPNSAISIASGTLPLANSRYVIPSPDIPLKSLIAEVKASMQGHRNLVHVEERKDGPCLVFSEDVEIGKILYFPMGGILHYSAVPGQKSISETRRESSPSGDRVLIPAMELREEEGKVKVSFNFPSTNLNTPKQTDNVLERDLSLEGCYLDFSLFKNVLSQAHPVLIDANCSLMTAWVLGIPYVFFVAGGNCMKGVPVSLHFGPAPLKFTTWPSRVALLPNAEDSYLRSPPPELNFPCRESLDPTVIETLRATGLILDTDKQFGFQIKEILDYLDQNFMDKTIWNRVCDIVDGDNTFAFPIEYLKEVLQKSDFYIPFEFGIFCLNFLHELESIQILLENPCSFNSLNLHFYRKCCKTAHRLRNLFVSEIVKDVKPVEFDEDFRLPPESQERRPAKRGVKKVKPENPQHNSDFSDYRSERQNRAPEKSRETVPAPPPLPPPQESSKPKKEKKKKKEIQEREVAQSVSGRLFQEIQEKLRIKSQAANDSVDQERYDDESHKRTISEELTYRDDRSLSSPCSGPTDEKDDWNDPDGVKIEEVSEELALEKRVPHLLPEEMNTETNIPKEKDNFQKLEDLYRKFEGVTKEEILMLEKEVKVHKNLPIFELCVLNRRALSDILETQDKGLLTKLFGKISTLYDPNESYALKRIERTEAFLDLKRSLENQPIDQIRPTVKIEGGPVVIPGPHQRLGIYFGIKDDKDVPVYVTATAVDIQSQRKKTKNSEKVGRTDLVALTPSLILGKYWRLKVYLSSNPCNNYTETLVSFKSGEDISSLNNALGVHTAGNWYRACDSPTEWQELEIETAESNLKFYLNGKFAGETPLIGSREVVMIGNRPAGKQQSGGKSCHPFGCLCSFRIYDEQSPRKEESSVEEQQQPESQPKADDESSKEEKTQAEKLEKILDNVHSLDTKF
eukprot:GHVP01006497.1.p1 GENE.GHVP01006497.1~~GHVP01006497.1.p1  ORF type:complete len:1002 (-),score=225.56 GHVP01006497.1:366-3371(-)